MGAGIFLIVVGALLAFAVEDHVPNLNLPVAGIILMVAGGVLLAYNRMGETTEKRVITREDGDDPSDAAHVVEEITRERHRD